MRRSSLMATLLFVPVLAMAQSTQPPAAQPNAPKMASDDVLALLEKGEVFFLDVREPKEFAVSHLPGAVNIPVGQIQQRVAEIPTGRLAVFICRSGTRSLTASAIATRAGLTNAAHLEGGLLAWAKEVDPSFVVAPVG